MAASEAQAALFPTNALTSRASESNASWMPAFGENRAVCCLFSPMRSVTCETDKLIHPYTLICPFPLVFCSVQEVVLFLPHICFYVSSCLG